MPNAKKPSGRGLASGRNTILVAPSIRTCRSSWFTLRLFFHEPPQSTGPPSRLFIHATPRNETRPLAVTLLSETVKSRSTVEDLVRLGREVERRVLAVRWYLEDRILVDGIRTVVFE